MGKVEKIFYIDMPSEIKETYQYYTEANMKKFVSNEYKFNFTNLEEGVSDYINNYLLIANIIRVLLLILLESVLCLLVYLQF